MRSSLISYRRLPASWQRRWYCQHARRLQRAYRPDQPCGEIVDRVLHGKPFRSNQKRGEIISVLELLAGLEPRCLCEIGAARGGNLYLFASATAVDARILSLDIDYPPERLASHPLLGKSGQQIACLGGDSHSVEMLDRVKQWLAGARFDFLFIDGDHSLAGVAKDFEMYSPLVRKGGLVAFHDIVPDYRTRFGKPTQADTGGVPEFWKTIRSKFSDAREFIENPDQDGYGIGVIVWPG